MKLNQRSLFSISRSFFGGAGAYYTNRSNVGSLMRFKNHYSYLYHKIKHTGKHSCDVLFYSRMHQLYCFEFYAGRIIR